MKFNNPKGKKKNRQQRGGFRQRDRLKYRWKGMIVRNKDEDEEETGLQREIQILNTVLEIRKTKREKEIEGSRTKHTV